MRKVLPIIISFLLLTFSMTQLAIAQKQNVITNQTTEALYVVYSTKAASTKADSLGDPFENGKLQNPNWKWRNEPLDWDVGETRKNHLYIDSEPNRNLWVDDQTHFLYQEIDTDNFDVETHFSAKWNTSSGVNGIMVKSPKDNNWVTIKFWSRDAGSKGLIQYQTRQAGMGPGPHDIQWRFGNWGDIELSLRLKKQGNTYTAWYKAAQDTNWVDIGQGNFNLTPPLQLGIYAGVAANTGKLEVEYEYFKDNLNPAEAPIPAGYRTHGWKKIPAGQQKTFWAYDPYKIYFQIWKGSDRIKPQRATQTFAFWINRNANFDIVTRQAINASITRGQLVYSSHDTSLLTHSDGFMRYNNGSRITVTDAWVDVADDMDMEADDTTDGYVDPSALAQKVYNKHKRTFEREDVQEVVPDVLIELKSPDIQLLMTQDAILLIANDPDIVKDILPDVDDRFINLLKNDAQIKKLIHDTDFQKLLQQPAAIDALFALITDDGYVDPSALAQKVYNKHKRTFEREDVQEVVPDVLIELKSPDIQLLMTQDAILLIANDPDIVKDILPDVDDRFINLLKNDAQIKKLIHDTDFQKLLQQPAAIDALFALITDGEIPAGEVPSGDNVPANIPDLGTAAVVSIDPPQTALPVGSQLTIHVKITNAQNVAGYQATVNFDPSVLQYVSSAYMDYPSTGAFFRPSQASEGRVSIAVAGIGGEVGAANGTLAKVTFEVVASKKPTIWLTDVTLSDPDANVLAVTTRDSKGERHPLYIPDPKLRAAIEEARGKASGATITRADMQWFGWIRVPQRGIHDITGLEFATNLTELDLSGNSIVDISPLKNLINLKVLNLEGNAITDFSPIAGLIPNLTTYKNGNQDAKVPVNIPDPKLRAVIEQALGKTSGAAISRADMLTLTDLFVPGPGVENLTGLEEATNLTSLSFKANKISDVSPLENLTQLTHLKISYNKISDVSPLRNLTQLTTLYLDENNISDVSPLENLTQLTTLSLDENNISDVSPLAKLTMLTTLSLWNNQISDFSPIAGLIPNLTAYSNKDQRLISVVDPNAPVNIPDPKLRAAIEEALGKTSGAVIRHPDMLTLRRLIIVNRGIENLTGLGFAGYLTTLSLGENNISDVSPLENLTRLRQLYLGNNKISDVSPLENLTQLINLGLDENNISDISPLAKLTMLRTLYLDENNISDISPLAKLTMLRTLHLDENNISDISPLAGLKNLKFLSLELVRIQVNLPDDRFVEHSSDVEIYDAEGYLLPNLPKSLLKQESDSEDDIIKLVRMVPLKTEVYFKFTVFEHGSWSSDYEYEQPELYASMYEKAQGGLYTISVNQTASIVLSQDYATSDINGVVSIPMNTGSKPGVAFINLEPLKSAQLEGTVRVVLQDSDLDGNQYFYKDFDLKPINITSQQKYKHRYTIKAGKEDTWAWVPVDGMRVEIEIRTGQIWSTGLEIGAFLKLYEGSSAKTDDLDAVACYLFIARWDHFYKGGTVFGGKGLEEFVLEDYASRGRGPVYNPTGLPAHKLRHSRGAIQLPKFEPAARIMGIDPDWKNRITPEINGGDAALVIFDFRLTPNWPPVFGAPAAKTTNLVSSSDVNNDGQIDAADLVLVSNHIGQSAPEMPPVDVNGDGIVTIADLVQVAQYLGQSTTASAPVSVVVPNGLTYETVEAWIHQARLEDDGSRVFHQGIAKLEYLLTLIIPEKTALLPNYPNPFNPETWIPYHLAEPAHVVLTLYSVDGKAVRRLDLGHQAAGYYQSRSRAAYWDGRNAVGERVASGLYFYTLTAGDFSATRKMLIMK